MRTAVCADLHLNNSNFGRMDKNGLSFRTKDFIAAFEFFVDYCISTLKPDRVIILGDIYDNPNPQNPVRKFFNKMIKRLSRAGIRVEIEVGNHDSCFFSHALQPVEEANFNNVRVHYEESFVVEDDCAFIFLPHTQEVERREKSHKLICREFGAKNAAAIAKAKSEGLSVVALGHFGVCGVEMNEGVLNKNREDVTPDDLAALDADIILLGHYHADQELVIPGTIRSMYVGSLERSTFNDKSKEKSFVVLDTEKGKLPVISRIVYPGARPMLTVTGTSEQIQTQIDAIKVSIDSGLAEPIVKIKFVGTETEYVEYTKSRKWIREVLSGAKHIAFEKDVVDPDKVAKANAVKQRIESKSDVGSEDILDIFRAYLEAGISDEGKRAGVLRLSEDIIKTVNERERTSKGIIPGRTRIHGVKLKNFQMYGTERNVVEFDKNCSHFFGRIGINKNEDWDTIRNDAGEFLSSLDPDEKRLISIVGKIDGDENQSNGSGKSSILDSISWAFYEKVVRDFFDKEATKKTSTTTVVRTVDGQPEKECYVEVLFSSGKSLYLVRRERKCRSLEDHSGGVYLYCLYAPDGVVDSGSMSGRRGADAESFIDQLVSMDFDTFSNSVMFGQSDADRFIRGTDRVKKEIFIKILGLTVLDQYLEEARDRKRIVEKDLASLEATVSALSSNTMSTDEITAAEERASTLAEEAKSLEKSVEQFTSTIKALREDPVFAQERQLDADASKYRALVKQRIEEAKRASKASSDALAAEEKVLAGHKRDVLSAEAAITAAQQEVERLEKKAELIDEKVLSEAVSMGEKARQAKQGREDEKNNLLAKKNEITVDVSQRNGVISAAKTRIEKLKKSLSKLGTKSEILCPECESPVSKSHVEEKIKQAEEEVAKLESERDESQKPLAGIQASLADVQKRLDNIDIYSDKARQASVKLEERKAAVAAVTPAKEKINDAETRKTEAQNRVTDSESKVTSFKAAIDGANRDAEKDNADYASKIAIIEKTVLETVIPNKRAVERKISEAESESLLAVEVAKSKLSEKAGILARIDVSKKTSSKIESAKLEQIAKTDEQDKLAIVDTGFGLDGIRVQIIENYIPLLNNYIDGFMDAMSDKMTAEVITDGRRDGKMEIKIKGESASDPRQLSKGQFSRVKVAIDLSLGMMSLVRNENAPDFVCLDEVFAPVDVSGKRAMLDVVKKLQEYFRLVLIISHDPFIQEAISSTIVVNQVNGCSTIEKQAHDA